MLIIDTILHVRVNINYIIGVRNVVCKVAYTDEKSAVLNTLLSYQNATFHCNCS